MRQGHDVMRSMLVLGLAGVLGLLAVSCQGIFSDGGLTVGSFASHVGMAAQVAMNMKGELNGLGIDTSTIMSRATTNPTALRVVVPEHSRKRLIVLSREDEKRIGEAVIAEMKAKNAFYTDAKQEKRVRAIAERVNAQLPEPLPLNLYLERDEQVNASCLLDGSVFVTSGLLKTITDDQQLAAVIAHEYGHAAARHGSENVTKMIMQEAGGMYMSEALSKATAAGSGQAGALLKAGYGLGSKYAVLLPYSRTMEHEADRLGALYMARAGYDPNAMVKVFELFQKMSPDSGIFSEFLSTHPMNQKRIDNVKLVIANEIR